VADQASEAKADPELRRQLGTAAALRTTIEAVIRLKPDARLHAELSPEQTEAATQALLARVAARTGSQARDCAVLRNLGCFVVAADAPFIRELLRQPEVESAAANRQPGGEP
jgi:hypothetical protein